MKPQILADVNPENYFYVCNGSVLKNLNDLHILLGNIDTRVFGYHVNESKNDFRNWVRDVIKDDVLSKNLTNLKTKEEAFTCVKRRINTLKNKSNRNTKEKTGDVGNKKSFEPAYANPEERKNIVSRLKRLNPLRQF